MDLPLFYGNELSSLRRCPKCDSQYDVDYSKDVCRCMNKKCNYMFCVIFDTRAPINTAPVSSIKT